MAKKKGKHKFSNNGPKKGSSKAVVQPAAIEARGPKPTATPVAEAPALKAPVVAPRAAQAISASGEARWRYVALDLRRIFVLLLICVAVELVLAYILDFTSFGTSIFNLIKI